MEYIDVNEIHKKLTNSNRATMPLSVYVSRFKPYFEDGLPIDKDNPIIRKFIQLSGSPYNSIDIIGDNGEIVAIAGPVHRDIAIKGDTSGLTGAVVQYTKDLRTVGHGVAVAGLSDEINKFSFDNDDDKKPITTWLTPTDVEKSEPINVTNTEKIVADNYDEFIG